MGWGKDWLWIIKLPFTRCASLLSNLFLQYIVVLEKGYLALAWWGQRKVRGTTSFTPLPLQGRELRPMEVTWLTQECPASSYQNPHLRVSYFSIHLFKSIILDPEIGRHPSVLSSLYNLFRRWLNANNMLLSLGKVCMMTLPAPSHTVIKCCLFNHHLLFQYSV